MQPVWIGDIYYGRHGLMANNGLERKAGDYIHGSGGLQLIWLCSAKRAAACALLMRS